MNHSTISADSDRLLRKPEVLAIIGVSETTLWRMQHRGEFPRPIQISRNTRGWLKSTVHEWLYSHLR